jgi:FlaA1/EpsC-like NDP-sugar epimerase
LPASVRIIGFVDDDNFKFGKVVHGRPILGSTYDLEAIHTRTWFNQILVAAEDLPDDRMAWLAEMAARHQIALRRFSIGLSEMAAPPSPSAPSGVSSLVGRPAAMNRV